MERDRHKLYIRSMYENSRWFYRVAGGKLHIIDKHGRTSCGINISPVYEHKRMGFTGTPSDLCRTCRSGFYERREKTINLNKGSGIHDC